MPTTTNAKKALRQSNKRRLQNRTQRSMLRNAVKNCRVAAAGEDSAAADSALRLAAKTLDQAAAKNLIHRNKAARTKSRLAKLVKVSSAAAAESASAAEDASTSDE